MIDLTEPGSTILIPWEQAVILDAKASNLVGTLANVGQGVDLVIVHNVAGVVADFDALVVNVPDNLHQGCSRAGVTAVLLDDDRYAVIPGDRSQLLEVVDP